MRKSEEELKDRKMCELCRANLDDDGCSVTCKNIASKGGTFSHLVREKFFKAKIGPSPLTRAAPRQILAPSKLRLL